MDRIRERKRPGGMQSHTDPPPLSPGKATMIPGWKTTMSQTLCLVILFLVLVVAMPVTVHLREKKKARINACYLKMMCDLPMAEKMHELHRMDGYYKRLREIPWSKPKHEWRAAVKQLARELHTQVRKDLLEPFMEAGWLLSD